MGAGDGNGNGNGTGPKTNEMIPCNGSPGHAALDGFGPLSKRPHVVPDPPQQVSDPANYAIAGKILLAVAGAFAGVLLALVALHLYSSTRRRRLGGQRRLLRSLAIAGGGDEDRRDGDGDGDGAGAPSPRGLDPAVLATIPGRRPARFHVECIDAWFRGNATCPLCRANVVVAPGVAAPSAPAEGGAQPEVRIDVAGDAVVAPANGSTVASVMGRLHSDRDLEKARRVFASTRFSSF
ncbi:unnamed protein product [Miscanthus lutarioriparius]|uniref:RING-type E3 ubiquitin transferase n=1 Tax=Miscanthus lutarioriparius TaxID=422564 RepID=A0A811P721_9POAL|nr:unnamed protein product [Miscanthus lutarioriparius]